MTDAAPHLTVKERSVPAATILATALTDIGVAEENGTVSAVTYIAASAVTGAASPASRTLSLINKGSDGSGTTVIASLALLGGVNLVAHDEKAITLSVTAADLQVAADDVLEWSSVAVGGTGLVDPGGTVRIEIARR